MNCQWVSTRLSALADGEISGREASIVRRHMQECMACASEYEVLVRIKGEVACLPVVDLPAGFEERLFASVARERKIVTQSVSAVRVSIAATAAAAAITLIALQWVRSGPSPQPFSNQAPVSTYSYGRDQMRMSFSDPLSPGVPVSSASFDGRR